MEFIKDFISTIGIGLEFIILFLFKGKALKKVLNQISFSCKALGIFHVCFYICGRGIGVRLDFNTICIGEGSV